MDQIIKKAWQAALLDPANEQGTGHLEGGDGKQCCLGVLANLAVAAGVVTKRRVGCTADNCNQEHITPYEFGTADGHSFESGVLPYAVVKWAGLELTNPIVETTNSFTGAQADWALTTVNDQFRKPFSEIAELVEQL